MPTGFNFKETAEKLDHTSFVEIYNFAINIRNALTDQYPNGWGADDIATFLDSEMKLLEKDIVKNIKNIYEHFETFYGCNVGAIGFRLHIQAEKTTKNTSEATSTKKLYAQTVAPSASAEAPKFFKPKRNTELVGKAFKDFQFDMARANAPKEKLIEDCDESLKDLVDLVGAMHQQKDGAAYAVMCFGLFIQNIIEMCVVEVDSRLDVGSAKAFIENAKNSFEKISERYKGEFKTQLSEILEKAVDDVTNKLTENVELAQPSQPTQSYLSDTLQKLDERDEKGERQSLLPQKADTNSSTCCTPCCVIM